MIVGVLYYLTRWAVSVMRAVDDPHHMDEGDIRELEVVNPVVVTQTSGPSLFGGPTVGGSDGPGASAGPSRANCPYRFWEHGEVPMVGRRAYPYCHSMHAPAFRFRFTGVGDPLRVLMDRSVAEIVLRRESERVGGEEVRFAGVPDRVLFEVTAPLEELIVFSSLVFAALLHDRENATYRVSLVMPMLVHDRMHELVSSMPRGGDVESRIIMFEDMPGEFVVGVRGRRGPMMVRLISLYEFYQYIMADYQC